MYRKYIKRGLDFVFALIALLLLSPLLLVITLWLYYTNKGAGAFFVQKRPGKGEKVFTLYKFKSMTDECDAFGNLLPDQKRLTSVGRFIRKTSIDELPQLWNVLKGNMSFIGPRPLLVEYIPLYSPRQKRRHEVRPGITGWAQVNGRNQISWEQRFELDIWYVDNCSFKIDFRIFFMTILKVLRHDGISSSTSETMEAFKGNE